MKMAGPPDQGGAQRCQRVRLLDGKRDVGNMLTLMASGNNADDDDDNSRCWPAAHQATRSPAWHSRIALRAISSSSGNMSGLLVKGGLR